MKSLQAAMKLASALGNASKSFIKKVDEEAAKLLNGAAAVVEPKKPEADTQA